MKLKNVLIVVSDIERSKAFYKNLFGLDVVLDNDGNLIEVGTPMGSDYGRNQISQTIHEI